MRRTATTPGSCAITVTKNVFQGTVAGSSPRRASKHLGLPEEAGDAGVC